MFAVIYSFKVKPGREKLFESSWKEMTLLIRTHEKSLGSRLHQESEHFYIAYALWPSKEVWENYGSNLPDSASKVSAQLRDTCSEIKTLFQLKVAKDLLA